MTRRQKDAKTRQKILDNEMMRKHRDDKLDYVMEASEIRYLEAEPHQLKEQKKMNEYNFKLMQEEIVALQTTNTKMTKELAEIGDITRKNNAITKEITSKINKLATATTLTIQNHKKLKKFVEISMTTFIILIFILMSVDF